MERAAELEAIAARVRACRLCGLHRSRTHAVPGEGPVGAGLVIVGEGPGRQEDESGRPFVGAAGRLLTRLLEQAGTSRAAVFITNAVKCRPPENRAPRRDEIDACRPYLASQIALVGPRAIVTMGASALHGLLGSSVDLAAARRRRRRYRGIPVFATYHPSAVRYDRGLANVIARDLARAARFAESVGHVRSETPVPGLPSRVERSSGGVVFARDGRVLLLRRADESIWCLPKGHVDPGETDKEAALREIAEETGLRARIAGPLLEVRYAFHLPGEPINVRKTVRYFRAEAVGGRLRAEAGFTEARWCDRTEALRLLPYANDRRVVRAAFEALSRKTP